jgi:8-amino-7-oxononanoate synthase
MNGESPGHLQSQLRLALEKRRQQSKLRSLKTSPPGSVDFSSNDFISLSTSPDYRAIFLDELNHIHQLGSTGSRLLDGNSQYAEHLEQEIAEFHHGPAGLLVNSGYDANAGIFSCLPQPGDLIVYDQLIHASVHDGLKVTRARRAIPFAHNSIPDLRKVLESIILECPMETPPTVFIAVESVYSMDGDLAPLAEIVELVEYLFPSNNAHIIVDEAHATGIYGEKGRGRVCELGLESKVFIRLHTFGKALACNGGKRRDFASTHHANPASHHHLHAAGTPIFDQLCPTPDLYDFHVIPHPRRHQIRLRSDDPRSDRCIGQESFCINRDASLKATADQGSACCI